MKVFISHAAMNKEIVLKFAGFLESVSNEIEVFCSSETGSIRVGSDFVETIYEELNSCDLFIPIISSEYYASRYCMIELGVAYSFLCNKYKNKKEEYIFPFAIYPVRKGQALSGTPIANIQTGEINNESDIRVFLDYLSAEKKINVCSGVNKKLHSFKFDVDHIFLKHQNLCEIANIGTYFDDSIDFRHKEDIADFSISKEGIIVNFNMNPYEKTEVKRPNFISLVLGYADKIDFNHYLDFNDAAEFYFVLVNFTNSLERIFVEFKYSDSNRILNTFKIPLEYGENEIRIPLNKMRSKVLGYVSEICFVIHPDDIVEDEGMFKICRVEII